MNLGIKDDAFVRGNVPMTKEEIRILTLVKAQIAPNAVVYDVGAGTGSLSVEAARLAPQGQVEGAAPAALDGLPPLDVALIGGSGRRLPEILDIIGTRMHSGGRIVANAITMQTVAACLDYFHAHAELYTYEAIQVQISRLERVGPYDMAKALNPIYIITAQRK